MRRPAAARRGFSLIEVVIAVGIFAGAIVVVLGLLSPINRSVTEVSETGRAAGLADAIRLELVRLRDTYTATSSLTRLDLLYQDLAGADTTRKQFVGSLDGARIIREADAGNHVLTDAPPGIKLRDRYYLVTFQFQPEKVDGVANPLSYTSGAPFLVVTATVQWPYQVPTGPGDSDVVTSATSTRQSITLNFALPP